MEYEYPYGDMQVHEALEDLDRRLKALEPKSAKPDASKPTATQSIGASSAQGIGASDMGH